MQKILTSYLNSLSSRIENNVPLSVGEISSIVMLTTESDIMKEHRKEMEVWIRSEVSRTGESCVINPRIRSLMYKKKRIAFYTSLDWDKAIDVRVILREYDIHSLSLFITAYMLARMGWDVEVFVTNPRVNITEKISMKDMILCTEATFIQHTSDHYPNPYCLPGTNPILRNTSSIGNSFPFDFIIVWKVCDNQQKLRNALKPTGKLMLWTDETAFQSDFAGFISSSVMDGPTFQFSPYLLDTCYLDTDSLLLQQNEDAPLRILEDDRMDNSCMICLSKTSNPKFCSKLLSTWLSVRSLVPQAILLVIIPSGSQVPIQTSTLEKMREHGIILRKDVDIKTIVELMRTYSIYLHIESSDTVDDPYLIMAQGSGMIPICIDSHISRRYVLKDYRYPNLMCLSSVIADNMTTSRYHDRNSIRGQILDLTLGREIKRLNDFLLSFIQSE